ncbi:hypothetical protein RHGRI_011935 [Rhododendron griersonianum]|uniref:Large ribosomal subunit protein bL28c n=1 Tax=Rhododendron griersonianum TaxID=479676 RepID=A0AAV6KP72_9ERIC|nr:hypothetical protein RHGRI_011935 [Rhododendron griersonianum]
MAVVTASSSSSGLWVGHSSTLRFSRPPAFGTKAGSQLGFLSSQFSGISISYPNTIVLPKPISAPVYRPFRPIARRICPFTGKKTNRANNVSHSNTKTKKLQYVNLQYKRIWWEGGKRWVKLRLSTKALKTIEKNGLDAVAKKAGVDLRKK